MLEATRGADHAIWVVAFLLYAIDAARVLAPREIMLVEASHGRLDAHFGGSPIGGAGRILAVAPLLLPHRGVFVAPWGQARKESAGLAETLRSLQELRRALLVVRLFAAEAFGTLFVLGPVLTLVLGPDAAVLYTAIVIYPTVVVAIAALWWQRRDLSLTNGRCARLSLEILVCPAFLPNLARKITTAQPITADGGQILLAEATPDRKEEVLTLLENRTEVLLADLQLDDSTHGHLRSYLAALRTTR